MATRKIFGYIGLIILIVIVVYIISFIRACNNGFGYQLAAGLGSLVDIGKEKYKSEYVQKYADSFFKLYPQYVLAPGGLCNL